MDTNAEGNRVRWRGSNTVLAGWPGRCGRLEAGFGTGYCIILGQGIRNENTMTVIDVIKKDDSLFREWECEQQQQLSVDKCLSKAELLIRF